MHFHHLIVFYLWKRKYAVQAAKKICAIYRDGEHPSRFAVVYNDQIKILIKSNPGHKTEILCLSYMSVVKKMTMTE